MNDVDNELYLYFITNIWSKYEKSRKELTKSNLGFIEKMNFFKISYC